jgi:glycosyltransferase involved in cell wall biosynthesis
LKLSVVIITRNQDWNVARLIRSVINATAALGEQAEIALVDSASTDDTVSIAAQFPVAVYALAADQRLTAAAGRYVGFMNTTGEYVLFVDGDVELIAGWLSTAIDVLDADDSIAVVGGRRIDVPLEATGERHLVDEETATPVAVYDVKHAGGDALYRRSVLDEVGTFNPFIYSDEEPELCIRIRYRGGRRVVRLDRAMDLHYTEPIDQFATLVGRAGRNLYVGHGQNLRMLLGSDLLIPYVRERGHGLLPLAWVVLGPGALAVSALTGSIVWIGVWLLVPVLTVGVYAVRKRSIRKAFHSLLKRSLVLAGTVRGFTMTPEDAADYPARLVSLA